MMGVSHLTPKDIDTAVSTLAGWAGDLTWDSFRLVLGTRLKSGHVYSKVALSKHARITHAFADAKKRLKAEAQQVGERSYGTSAVAALRRQVDRLKVELSEEKTLTRELTEQFVRWQFNAERFGVMLHQLDAPLVNPAKDARIDGKRNT